MIMLNNFLIIPSICVHLSNSFHLAAISPTDISVNLHIAIIIITITSIFVKCHKVIISEALAAVSCVC